jgi:hypothetical protein
MDWLHWLFLFIASLGWVCYLITSLSAHDMILRRETMIRVLVEEANKNGLIDPKEILRKYQIRLELGHE